MGITNLCEPERLYYDSLMKRNKAEISLIQGGTLDTVLFCFASGSHSCVKSDFTNIYSLLLHVN